MVHDLGDTEKLCDLAEEAALELESMRRKNFADEYPFMSLAKQLRSVAERVRQQLNEDSQVH